MTGLQRFALASLVIGLIAAAFVVPWSLKSINQKREQLELVAEQTAPVAVPTPDPQVVVARQLEQVRRAAAAKAAAEQSARIQAALAEVAIPQPAPPAPTPEPPKPAYSFAAPGPDLIPLEGWVDQPNKDRPGRVHTNLMIRHVPVRVVTRTPSRPPCLVLVTRPAERIERPYGYVDVPERTIPVPCGQE
jgi:hypothetical protein